MSRGRYVPREWRYAARDAICHRLLLCCRAFARPFDPTPPPPAHTESRKTCAADMLPRRTCRVRMAAPVGQHVGDYAFWCPSPFTRFGVQHFKQLPRLRLRQGLPPVLETELLVGGSPGVKMTPR